MHATRAVLCLTVAMLAACAVNAPSRDPAPAAVDATQASSPADAAFWASFGSPLLQSLLRQVLDGNPDLLIAGQRGLIAYDAAQIAEAQQRPALAFHAGPVDTTATSLASQDHARPAAFELGFQASYELDLWGRLGKLSAAARAEALASTYDTDAIRIATMCLLAGRVFDLGQADQMLVLLQRRQALTEDRVQLQRLRLRAGRIDAQTLAEAEAQSDAARDEQASWQARRRDGESRLALLLGQSPEGYLQPLGPLQAQIRIPGVPADLPSSLLLRRPDLRAAAARLDAASDRDAADHALRFPQIRLTAEFGVASDVLHRAAHGAIALFGLGPEVNLPIYDGGATSAQIDSREHELAIAQLEYRKASIAAFADVDQALQMRAAAAARQRTAEAARQRCESVQQAVALELQLGRKSRLDAIDAQVQSLAAEQRVLESYRAQLDSALALFEALGGAWPSG